MCNQDLHSNDHVTWIDHFVYDGSIARFYGEIESYYQYFDFDGWYACDLWWVEPSAQWYVIGGIFCPGDPLPTPEPHQPPVAFASIFCTGLACRYEGGTSHDPDGTIVSWAWTLGDGT